MQTRAGIQGACAAFGLLCTFGLVWPVLPAAAKPNAAAMPAARRAIQAAYNQIDAALARKDVDTVGDFDADDCEYYNRKGKLMDAGGGRQELIDLLEYVDTIHRTATIVSFTGSDTDAIVTVKFHVVARSSNSVNGRAIRAVSDDVSRDYWIKTDDGWRRKRVRQLTEKVSVHKNFQPQ